MLRLHDLRFEHLGRGERARHEDHRVLAPGHDVDLLAPQLPDDGLDAGALDPNARADRVDLVVVADHGDLGAGAGLARDSLDLDDLLRHLRHLGLEEAAQEFRMRPRQDDLRAARELVDRDDVGLDVVALVVAVARDLLARRKDRLRAVELHVDVPTIDLLHRPAHHLPHAVVIVLVDPLALRLADPLHEHLLGRGDRVSAQVLERQLLEVFLTHPGVGIVLLGLFQIDFLGRILGVLHDPALEAHENLAAGLVEFHLDVGRLAEPLPACGKQPRLERLDEDGLVHALLARDLGHRLHQLVVDAPCMCLFRHRFHPFGRRSFARSPSHGSATMCECLIAVYGNDTTPTFGSSNKIVSPPACRSSPRNTRRP